MLYAPGWNPMRWAIAPCVGKATNLYWELFKAYVRLNALKSIYEEKDPATKGKKLLGTVTLVINEMIDKQPAAYVTTENTQAQIARLVNTKNKTEELKTIYNENNEVLRKLNEISVQLKSIGNHFNQPIPNYPEANDPIRDLLRVVKGMVEEAIHKVKEL